MTEAEAIISAYNECGRAGKACVLATVVHVEGSAYRRAGARMLIDEDGMMTGAISGGCLEGDALRKALHALHRRENKLVTYDTTDEDDAVIGAQLGCNGIIQVLFEVADREEELNPVKLLEKAVSTGRPAALVVMFDLERRSGSPGTTLVYTEAEGLPCHEKTNGFKENIEAECLDVIRKQHSYAAEVHTKEGLRNIFIQYIQPPIHLVIVGAGNDARPLADMGNTMGWKVTVTDGRPSHATSQRFDSSCTVVVTRPEDTLQNIRIDARTAFVLLSHNYQYDLAVLGLLLDEAELPYIGILGPKKKYNMMLDDLKAEGIELTQDQSDRVYAPVGLHFRAETPAEIALAIISEIQTVIAGGEQHHLRDKKGPIHHTAPLTFNGFHG